MPRRLLAAALLIALAHVDYTFAQTVVAAAPGTLRESIRREVAKQVLVNVSSVSWRSAGPGTSSKATAPPESQLAGPFIRGSFKQQVFAAIGAAVGLFGGGYLGAKIEGNRCHCDDPGLAGALIGASIGGIAGGIVGYKLGK